MILKCLNLGLTVYRRNRLLRCAILSFWPRVSSVTVIILATYCVRHLLLKRKRTGDLIKSCYVSQLTVVTFFIVVTTCIRIYYILILLLMPIKHMELVIHWPNVLMLSGSELQINTIQYYTILHHTVNILLPVIDREDL